ncbi:unnamed protein product [Closterium sp. NIES-53]
MTVPLRFEHIHHRNWKHLDGRPWVPHHPHPRELAMHDPDPGGICRDCHMLTASTSAIASCGLAAISEAEREAPLEEGLSTLELETATRVVFGTEETTLPRPASQHLWGMRRGTGIGTFDARGVPRPYTRENFLEIYSHQCDSTKKLTVAQEEELARREAEELRQRTLADGARATLADGEPQLAATLADGEPQLAATPADGAPHLAARQADGATPANTGGLPARTRRGRKKKSRQNLHHQSFPLLEPGTNRYAKLEKVYSDFLNVGHFGINDEMYTLTFVDAGTCYVWIVNVEARSRVYKVFRFWLAHAQQQSGEKLKIWQSDGAAEFRSKEMQDYLAQKGIKHHVSLHGLLSTTAITGNSSPHVKWMGTKGNTSMLRVWGCMVQYRPPTSTIGKFASRTHWGNHLGISHEHKAWLILDLMSQKDEAAAAIQEQESKGEFTRGDCRDDDDDEDNDSPGGGAGASGGCGSGSGRGAALPAPPEPECDDDDVQEVIPQHRHDSTASGLQLLGLHTATSTAPRVIEPKNPRQALTGPHSKEWREVMDAEIKALDSRDTWVLVDRAAIKGRRILSGKWAPRLWQQYLHNILLEIGFKQLPQDPGMYRRNFRGEYILLTVYVDDLLYRGSSNKLLEQFEKSLGGRVDITCNHDVKKFLGLNISYSPEAIHLSAVKYAEELGKRFNIAPAPLSIPYRTSGPNHKPDNKALSPAGLHTY